MESILFKTRV